MQKAPAKIQANTNITDGRPYRSHLQPACLECRKRKSRCKTRAGSVGCVLCHARGTQCIFPQTGHQANSKTTLENYPSDDLRLSGPVHDPESQDQLRSLRNNEFVFPSAKQALHPSQQVSLDDSMGLLNEFEDESPHVVGPTLENEEDELEDYLHTGSERSRRLIHPTTSSAATKQNARPVVFTTIHRRPVGTVPNQSLAASKCEIIEKLIEPYAQILVDLYFERANPCFPVFSRTSFLRIYKYMKGNISPAVLSNLYANSLTYWDSSSQLSSKRHPDRMFVWLQANEALNSESFLSPGLSTILALILNIGGRPSTSVFGNGSSIGIAVARANALGLNRDPTDWNISETERLFRIRIWWLLVMQDRWWSLAYGLPLQINSKQFDVPAPSTEQLARVDEVPTQNVATTVFVSLTTLTTVLGDMLEYIYDVGGQVIPVTEALGDSFEHSLNRWEDAQTDAVRRIIFRGTNLSHSGAANLRMAYLSIKFLLKRLQVSISVRTTNQQTSQDSKLLMQANRAAEAIVHFVQELDENLTRGFWFPMHAYTLTSATRFLLRSALSRNNPNPATGRLLVIDMIKSLHDLKSKYSWDLADNCLSTYGDVVEKLVAKTTEPDLGAVELGGLPEITMSGFEDLFDGFDDYIHTDLEDFLQNYPQEFTHQT